MFMVGDFKQAIFGFQGTDPQRVRGDARKGSRSAAALARSRGGCTGRCALEFRDLSIDASFRSAPAVLDVVDAVIAEVGSGPWGCPSAPNPHVRTSIATAGRGRAVAAVRGRRTADDGERRGGLDRRSATGLCRRLGEQVRRWIDEAPVLASTGRPLTPGRHIGPGAQPRRARLADRRAAVRGRGAGGRDRPPASAGAARGAGSARRGGIRGSAARRPQPCQSAGVAADRVGPGAVVRLGLRARGTPCGATRARGQRSDRFARPRDTLAELLAMADFTTPSRFLETILSGRCEGRRKLYGRLGLAARDPIDELLQARSSSNAARSPRSTASSPGSRAARSRSSATLGAGQRGAGDDRPRRQGARSAGRDPRRRDRRPGQAGRSRGDARLSGRGRGKVPLIRPRKEERCRRSRRHRRGGGSAISRSIGGCSMSG